MSVKHDDRSGFRAARFFTCPSFPKFNFTTQSTMEAETDDTLLQSLLEDERHSRQQDSQSEEDQPIPNRNADAPEIIDIGSNDPRQDLEDPLSLSFSCPFW